MGAERSAQPGETDSPPELMDQRAEWPREWAGGGLSPEDRVRAVLTVIADGTTAAVGQIHGLPEASIQEVEADQAAPVGEAYRCFLALAGGGAGRFMQGSDVFHPEVLGLWADARELLEENGSQFALEPSDRVIYMHQGYQFDFLRGSGPDPEVWSYCEAASPGNAPRPSHDRFTDWLRANAEQQMGAWARLSPWFDPA